MARSKKFFTVLEHQFIDRAKSGGVIHTACMDSILGGADGLFIVFSGGVKKWLGPLLREVSANLGAPARPFILGVNSLGSTPYGALSWGHVNDVAAVWTDTVFDDAFGLVAPPEWECRCQWFGGVEFKYQPKHPAGPANAIRSAMRTPAVITTSGEGTGIAPGVDKLRAFREVMGPRPELAVASGVDALNVEHFLPFVDTFIVRTSLETKGRLDPEKINTLATLIHA